MTKWIAMAALVAGLAAAAHDAIAADRGQDGKFEASLARSATRHRHHADYVYRPSCPEYIDRPCYYAPKPFFPLPPIYGYGWEWW